MKTLPFLLAGIFLLLSACTKDDSVTDLFTETTKTDCVWKTPNNKIIPCQFMGKWEKYEQAFFNKDVSMKITTYYCTTEDYLPGILCKKGSINDCTHIFGCTHCLNC